MRTQDEIIARVEAIRGTSEDLLGFRTEVLLEAVDYEHVKPYLKDGVGPDDWSDAGASEDAVRASAVSYLTFAFGKAEDHRGISANRSVEKLEEFAWLLERDDVLTAMREADYAQYGVPKLLAFAGGFELPVPESETLRRMGEGLPCREGCVEGCGL